MKSVRVITAVAAAWLFLGVGGSPAWAVAPTTTPSVEQASLDNAGVALICSSAYGIDEAESAVNAKIAKLQVGSSLLKISLPAMTYVAGQGVTQVCVTVGFK